MLRADRPSSNVIIPHCAAGWLLGVRHHALHEGGRIGSVTNSKEKIKEEPFLLYKPIWQYFTHRRHAMLPYRSV